MKNLITYLSKKSLSLGNDSLLSRQSDLPMYADHRSGECVGG